MEDCNGNLIGEVTMESGSSTFRKLCLKDKSFTVMMNGGTYQVTTHYDADLFFSPSSLFTRCTIHYTCNLHALCSLIILLYYFIILNDIKGRSILDFKRCQRTDNH
jgi:hypothetical protein